MFGFLARKLGYVKIDGLRDLGYIERPDFWWFPERSSAELAARIAAAGPGHRLEVRLDADRHMTFRVVPADRAARLPLADINESRHCPPICG